MKTWNTPVIEELEINQTAGGGPKSNNFDNIYLTDEQLDALRKLGFDVTGDWAGFAKVSGK
ncbi:hypothetical protein [Butyrivibrio sp. VCB2006]|uniref:hypothetical protein n=1 Tax=Butyrivibrio sp. VCB2006 TaxID=1280679 RepID=UPI000416B3B7|nr:hypothetical protein [Butyrivibrio sp. VCB2006]